MNQYDPRIKNELCIRDPFTIDTGKQYIGKRGYFTDDIFNFSNLDNCFAGMLAHVESDSRHPYYCAISDEGVIIKGNFSFFLSAEFVEEKPKEKKYRVLTIDEFLEKFHLGDGIILRSKKHRSLEFHVVYEGYAVNTDSNEIQLYLSSGIYTLPELFQSYERFYNGRWVPFGVEE